MVEERENKINLVVEFSSKFYERGFLNKIKEGFGGDNPLYGFRNFLKYELFPFLYHNKVSGRLLFTSGKEINSLDFIVFGLLSILDQLGEKDYRDLMVDFSVGYGALGEIGESPKETFEIIMPLLRSDQKELVLKVLARRGDI